MVGTVLAVVKGTLAAAQDQGRHKQVEIDGIRARGRKASTRVLVQHHPLVACGSLNQWTACRADHAASHLIHSLWLMDSVSVVLQTVWCHPHGTKITSPGPCVHTMLSVAGRAFKCRHRKAEGEGRRKAMAGVTQQDQSRVLGTKRDPPPVHLAVMLPHQEQEQQGGLRPLPTDRAQPTKPRGRGPGSSALRHRHPASKVRSRASLACWQSVLAAPTRNGSPPVPH